MKSIIYERWGTPDVLHMGELPEPVAGTGEVVVAWHALAINPKDVLVRKGKLKQLPGVKLPLVPCHDLAGVVTEVGPGADLQVGQPVYGWFESFTGGAGSERVAIKADHLAAKPASMTMHEAASVPLAALTALMALRDELRIQPGQHVVIHGASGGVGVFAVQIAKLLGATVTAVCSARNEELVRALGADHHVDYAVTDPATLRGVDAFFDVFGNKPWKVARATLGKSGRYCTTIPRADTAVRGVLAHWGLHRAHLVVVRSRRADLEQLTAWIDAGALRTVVQQVLPWTEIAEAHRMVETKHTQGKIVLEVVPGS